MRRRILYGALLLAAVLSAYLLDTEVLSGALLSRAVVWLLGLGLLHELLALAGRRVERGPGLFLMGALALLVAVALSLLEGRPVPGALLVVAALVAGGVRLLGMAPLRTAPAAFPESLALAASVGFVGGTLGFLDRLAVESVASAYAVVAVSKVNDICAYFVGSLLGRVRIVPAVSPKKTWEGTIAGVLGATGAAALLASPLMGHDVPRLHAAAVGAVLGAASFLGDLLGSGLKRWAGVKDSASLFPEFGGILDLLDGVLLASPVAVLCIHGS